VRGTRASSHAAQPASIIRLWRRSAWTS
jgi:hypothetical protein